MNHKKSLISLLVLVCLGAIIALAFQFGNKAAPGLTLTDVQNATYDTLGNTYFWDPGFASTTLKDGAFSSTTQTTYITGYTQTIQYKAHIAEMDQKPLAALGDLTGDGMSDAAVMLDADYDAMGVLPKDYILQDGSVLPASVSTSTGSTRSLNVLVYKDGKAILVGHTFPRLNGEAIKGLEIRNGAIILSLSSSTLRYKLSHGVLVSVGSWSPTSLPDTSDWVGYSDSQEGYRITHPKDMAETQDPDGVELGFNGDRYQGSSTVDVSYIISAKIQSFGDCVSYFDPVGPAAEQMINGLDFYATGGGDSAMGQHRDTSIYSTWKDGTCYSLTENRDTFSLNRMADQVDAATLNQMAINNKAYSADMDATFYGMVDSFRLK